MTTLPSSWKKYIPFVPIIILDDFLRARGGVSGIILNLCTGLGYLGGMPKAPRLFDDFIERFPIMRWVLVMVLIYQGGGEQNLQLAIEITVIFYLIHSFLMEIENSGKYDEFKAGFDCVLDKLGL